MGKKRKNCSPSNLIALSHEYSCTFPAHNAKRNAASTAFPSRNSELGAFLLDFPSWKLLVSQTQQDKEPVIPVQCSVVVRVTLCRLTLWWWWWCFVWWLVQNHRVVFCLVRNVLARACGDNERIWVYGLNSSIPTVEESHHTDSTTHPLSSTGCASSPRIICSFQHFNCAC